MNLTRAGRQWENLIKKLHNTRIVFCETSLHGTIALLCSNHFNNDCRITLTSQAVMASSIDTQTEITLKGSVDIVSEFFFTAINSILYQRGKCRIKASTLDNHIKIDYFELLWIPKSMKCCSGSRALA